MSSNKKHWFWNVLIVITVITCLLSFVAHYKNWVRVKKANFEILSGVYHQSIPFDKMNDVIMEDKLPSMERVNGFSVAAIEKGIFSDSISNAKVYVFVDDLKQRKIKLTYQDSLVMYLNFKDSVQTQKQFDFFKDKVKQ